jgi:trans-aconitate 2-methyltransferase
VSASPWNPDQYERFRDERSLPFFELLAMVQPRPGGSVIDLGCGTGELTAVLHRALGAKATLGLDSSETMLERSAALAVPGLTFRLGTIARFAPRKPYDVVFSNAALQWLDDHPRLFERLAAGVAPGGQLAVQVPANDDHPSHQTAFALASEEPWRGYLGGYRREWPVLKPERYAELLDRLGFARQEVRLRVYAHHLAGPEAVVEWVKGTLLTDYERRLEPPAYAAFLAEYRRRLMAQLPDSRPYFYAFKRVLLAATKAG